MSGRPVRRVPRKRPVKKKGKNYEHAKHLVPVCASDMHEAFRILRGGRMRCLEPC